jgi:hypothetical protein
MTSLDSHRGTCSDLGTCALDGSACVDISVDGFLLRHTIYEAIPKRLFGFSLSPGRSRNSNWNQMLGSRLSDIERRRRRSV